MLRQSTPRIKDLRKSFVKALNKNIAKSLSNKRVGHLKTRSKATASCVLSYSSLTMLDSYETVQVRTYVYEASLRLRPFQFYCNNRVLLS